MGPRNTNKSSGAAQGNMDKVITKPKNTNVKVDRIQVTATWVQ